MIDWKRKLSSRKFWALVAGFVTGLVVFIASPGKSPESIGGLVMSLGSIVAYCIGEGISDHTVFTTNYNSPNVFGEVLNTENESEENNNG